MAFNDGDILYASSLNTMQAAITALQANPASATVATAAASRSLSVTGSIGATSSGILLTPALPQHLLCLQFSATVTAGASQNYTVEVFDGLPAANLLVYQATGITLPTYTDNGLFYVPPVTGGSLYVRMTNIGTVAFTATAALRYLALT